MKYVCFRGTLHTALILYLVHKGAWQPDAASTVILACLEDAGLQEMVDASHLAPKLDFKKSELARSPCRTAFEETPIETTE